MMRAIRWSAIAAIIALCGMLGWNWYQHERVIPEPMPELALAALEDQPGFDLSDLNGPYLLNVWGSWCAGCRIEHRVLMALEAEGVPIYGLNWRDEPAAANAFLDELGNPFRASMRLDDSGAQALALSGAPETLLIGTDGQILVRWPGPLTVDVLNNRIYPVLTREIRKAQRN